MDRASGSGVFARDPDALLDLIELDVNENLVEQQSNRAVCDICMRWLQKYGKEDIANEDDQCSEKQMLAICRVNLKAVYEEIIKDNGLQNGEVDIAIRIIREAYENNLRNRSFVEDVRGYGGE